MSSTKLREILSVAAAAGVICAHGVIARPRRRRRRRRRSGSGFTRLSSLSSAGGADDKEDPSIDYRDHGRLVVPPKIDLPPPAAKPAASNPAWPVDNDQQKKKKAKAEAAQAKIERYGRPTPPRPDGNGTVTVKADVDDTAAPKPKCQRSAAPGDTCTQTASSSFNWNPLTWVGVEKKGPTVLGPEPDRDWLTDPPKGYRAPVEGVGAKLDN